MDFSITIRDDNLIRVRGFRTRQKQFLEDFNDESIRERDQSNSFEVSDSDKKNSKPEKSLSKEVKKLRREVTCLKKMMFRNIFRNKEEMMEFVNDIW
jgi:hypothetical protein